MGATDRDGIASDPALAPLHSTDCYQALLSRLTERPPAPR